MSNDRYVRAKPRVRHNIGCCMDIPTGDFKKGKHGERILNGGLSAITGVGGRGNMYKSTLAHYMNLVTAHRYNAEGLVYDTEESLDEDRMIQLAEHITGFDAGAAFDEGQMVLTSKVSMSGNKLFEEWRSDMTERGANEKEHLKTTPFLSRRGEHIKVMIPHVTEIDSFSQMDIDAVDKMYLNNEVGESGLNMEAMKSAAAKSQLMMQLPRWTGVGGGKMILTAHVGDEHQLDPYAPPQKKLAFLKGKVKFKRVPENFTFLCNNCWYVTSAEVLMNPGTKAPEYPMNSADALKGDTDLMKIVAINVRGKSGPSGLPLEFVVSQREGLKPGLTQLNLIKNNRSSSTDPGFGLEGNTKNYTLALYPDAKLSRTTVRSKIDNDLKLQRALELTADICQIKVLWAGYVEHLELDPVKVREKLEAKGYDWDLILTYTRGYWMFEEDVTETTPYFLSVMDVLHMCFENDNPMVYHPWWYEDAVKKYGVKPVERPMATVA